MKYEKYKAWIENEDFEGQFWYVPQDGTWIRSPFDCFRYRLSSRQYGGLGNYKGQYVSVIDEYVEMGEFECGANLGNLYLTKGKVKFCQCDFSKTVLHRIGYKKCSTYAEVIQTLRKKETLIGYIFDENPMRTDCGVQYFEAVPRTITGLYK